MFSLVPTFKKFILAMCFSALLPVTAMADDAVTVTINNYVQAVTSMQMNDYQKLAEGVNKWFHLKTPVSIDKQTTIRMNRDTLYSFGIINVSKGATVTLPDAGKRYISLMVLNEYGYTNLVYYGKGTYELNPQNVGSDYALIFVRILVDSNDPKDVAIVNELQDKLEISAKADAPFTMPDWNMPSYKEMFDSLLQLFAILPNAERTFGTKAEVDPVRFLLGATGGFGGLPSKDATYINVQPDPTGKAFKMVLKDVPVDGFWSVSVYNKEGYFFKSEHGASSINNLIATPSKDGSYTIYFGDCKDEKVNCLAIKDGWNFVVRLYRPEADILSSKWKLPKLEKID